MTDIDRRNRRVLAAVGVAVAVMVGLAFASVPLYSLFCKATGFGGTPVTAAFTPGQVTARHVTIHFNADISPDLDWNFRPEKEEIDVLAGQKGFISFLARNNETAPVTGTAIYNVTPLKVGKYFHKIQCFCFGQQVLEPGKDAVLPVIFFVDPAFARDPDMQDVSDITLSYTFFRAASSALDRAVKRIYTSP